MQLTKGVHFPRWIIFAGLGVQAINLLFWLRVRLETHIDLASLRVSSMTDAA
jgi:hypothetical protein